MWRKETKATDFPSISEGVVECYCNCRFDGMLPLSLLQSLTVYSGFYFLQLSLLFSPSLWWSIFLCITSLPTRICVEFLRWAFWSIHTWTPLWAVTVSNSWANTGICSYSLACQHCETAWSKLRHSLLSPPPSGFHLKLPGFGTEPQWADPLAGRRHWEEGRREFWKKGRKKH